jgi:hypothetical protein
VSSSPFKQTTSGNSVATDLTRPQRIAEAISSATSTSAKGVVEHPGTAMTVGTFTVSSQIKDPSIVFRFLPSCPANRHAMKLGEQTATPAGASL